MLGILTVQMANTISPITLMYHPLCSKCCMMPSETAESSFTSAHSKGRSFSVLQSFHHHWLQILGVHGLSVASTLGNMEYVAGWVVLSSSLLCHQHREAVVQLQPCSREKHMKWKQGAENATLKPPSKFCCSGNVLSYRVPFQSSYTSRIFWARFGETWQKPLHVPKERAVNLDKGVQKGNFWFVEGCPLC